MQREGGRENTVSITEEEARPGEARFEDRNEIFPPAHIAAAPARGPRPRAGQQGRAGPGRAGPDWTLAAPGRCARLRAAAAAARCARQRRSPRLLKTQLEPRPNDPARRFSRGINCSAVAFQRPAQPRPGPSAGCSSSSSATGHRVGARALPPARKRWARRPWGRRVAGLAARPAASGGRTRPDAGGQPLSRDAGCGPGRRPDTAMPPGMPLFSCPLRFPSHLVRPTPAVWTPLGRGVAAIRLRARRAYLCSKPRNSCGHSRELRASRSRDGPMRRGGGVLRPLFAGPRPAAATFPTLARFGVPRPTLIVYWLPAAVGTLKFGRVHWGGVRSLLEV